MPAHHLFQRNFARAAARRAPLAAALAILAGLSCFDAPAGPRILPTAGFSFAPQFSSSAAMVVDFVQVRIVFTRPGTNQIALDTVVSFPSDADSITLNLAVPTQGVGQSENLTFSLAMINAAGDTVFRGGPDTVTVTAGSTAAPVTVPIHYTGVGANAAAVRIAARDTSVFFNDSVVLTAVALDSANQPIAGTPIEWTSLDTARALVPLPNSGKVLGRTQRGLARIRARLVTGQADTGLVRVQPVPSALALLAGNGQSGTVDATLPQPLAVRVTAVDGLGVVGVKVRFTLVSGGGKVDTLVVTDTTGLATAQLRLGTLAGPDTVRATVTGLTGSPVTFVATALPGIAKSLAVTAQPSATSAGSPIAPAVLVAARDTFGNVATAFTGTVTLAIGTNPASGTLSGTMAVSAVAGVATFSNLTIDKVGTGYTLTATATGLATATTVAFNVVPGAPTHLGFGLQPGTTVAGTLLAPAARVLILDALGNIVTSRTDSVTIAFGANPAGGVLAGTLRVAAVAGVADFPSLRIVKAGTGYTLAASATGLTSATSGAFSVTAGAPATIGLTSGNNQMSTISTALAAPLIVFVQDALGNGVPGIAVNWAVTVGGGSVPAATSLTDTTGHAQTTWTLGTLVGAPQTAAATIAGVTGSPVVFTASATPVGANAWKNPAGGLWSTVGNWSLGRVPISTDNAVIALPGTYTVTLNQTALVGAFSASYGQLDLNGFSLSVTGSFALSNTATLRMANAAGALNVTGNASFAGGSSAGLLTAGTINLEGHFRQEGDPQSFQPTGVTTWAGTGSGNDPSQVFTFQNPGATLSRFADFVVYGDVRFASDVYVAGALDNMYTVKDTLGSWTATLAGAGTNPGDWQMANTILAYAATSWPATTTTNLILRNSLSASGYPVNGNVTIQAGGVLVNSGEGTVAVTGDVTVEDGGVLNPGYGSVDINGSLATTGTGLLRQSGGYIQVIHDASFAGTSELTGGYLEISGNFTQLGTTSFQASAVHLTSFTNPTVAQTVSFAAPDTAFAGTGSHFGILEMGANGGIVQLLTDAAVQGTFSRGYQISGTTLRGTHTLFTRGLNQSNLTIDGTLLVLLDGEPGQSPNFGSMTFRNQPPAATQFWIRRSETCLSFYGLQFETVPGTDGHYVGVENLSGGSSQNIYFGSGSPASLEPYVQSIGSPTINYTYGSCGPA